MKISPILNNKVYIPNFKHHASYYYEELDSFETQTTAHDVILSGVIVAFGMCLFSALYSKLAPSFQNLKTKISKMR